jgi:hypothetical protein
MKVAAVLHSPRLRAAQTAAILAEDLPGVPVHANDLLDDRTPIPSLGRRAEYTSDEALALTPNTARPAARSVDHKHQGRKGGCRRSPSKAHGGHRPRCVRASPRRQSREMSDYHAPVVS